MIKSLLSTNEYLLYITLTNYVAVLGGVALWAAFFMLGLIARQLERSFETPTGWQLLQWGPSGILLYTVYTLVQAGPGQGGVVEFILERQIAYVLLFLSGISCAVGCYLVYRTLARLSHFKKDWEF